MNVSEFLLIRLKDLGVDHVFGIPGDYILSLFEIMEDSDVQHIATCNELNGGYAADGYARVKGLGAVAVTYGPGSFSLVNAVAGAYAERAPVVVISGGPPTELYETQPPMHHLLPERYDAAMRIFEQVTVGSKRIDDPATAADDIDELLSLCITERRPVYLEIPQDIQRQPCRPSTEWTDPETSNGDVQATEAAVQMLSERLKRSEHCVFILGHEIMAAGLQDKVRALVDKTQLPVASAFSGKADFMEMHPRCIGVYHGLGSADEVKAFVEGADSIVWFGAVASDFNRGGVSADVSDQKTVLVCNDRVEAAEGSYARVSIVDLVDGLLASLPEDQWKHLEAPAHSFPHRGVNAYTPQLDAPISNERFYARIATFLRAGDIVLADAGPCINMAYVQMPSGVRYFGSGYWASIGAGFGMSVGAAIAADAGQRVLAFEGDGAFQMTAQEISTLVRFDKPAVIFLMNNRGYTAERLIHDGDFNDIQNWSYHRLPEVFGGETGCDVHTEGDLEAALARAEKHKGPGPLMIEVHLDPFDVPEAFLRMSEGLRSH